MKKRGLLRVVLFFIILLLSAPNCFSFDVFEKSHVQKAKDFIAADMHEDAILVLNEEIKGSEKHQANPTNAEAHFLLGLIYASKGKIPEAKERFASAKKLDPEYEPIIGNELFAIAKNKLKDKDFVMASSLLEGAMQYNAELKKEIASKQFELGVIFANQGNAAKAEKNFESASQSDSKYKSEIPLEYKKAAYSHLKNNNVEKALPLYELALSRDPALKKEIADELFQYGKENNSEYLITKAVKFNPKLKTEAKTLCWSQVEKLNGRELLNLSWNNKQCGQLTEAQKEIIGKKLLAEGNSQNSDNHKEEYYKEAAKYVDNEIIFNSTVEYYSKKLGPPQIAELNITDDWKFVGHVRSGYRIEYLSLESFIRKDDKNTKKTWDASPSRLEYYTFYGKTDSDIWFGKNQKNTIVYYWVTPN